MTRMQKTFAILEQGIGIQNAQRTPKNQQQKEQQQKNHFKNRQRV